jgi:hypothetical protein
MPLLRRAACTRAFVPFDRQRLDGLRRLPVAVRDNRDAVAYVDRTAHTGQILDRREIVALHFAAEDRAMRDGRVQHAGQPHVDAEDRRAVDFRRHIDAPCRFASEFELLRRLDLDLGHVSHCSGRSGQLAVGCGTLAAGVVHLSQLCTRLRVRNAPRLRSRCTQSLACIRTGCLHRDACAANREAADGRHAPVDVVLAQTAVRRCVLDADLLPVHFELFCDQHRQRREHALTHLGLRTTDDDGVIRLDREPRAHFTGAARMRLIGTRLGGSGKADCQQQTPGGARRGDHEFATVQHVEPSRRVPIVLGSIVETPRQLCNDPGNDRARRGTFQPARRGSSA